MNVLVRPRTVLVALLAAVLLVGISGGPAEANDRDGYQSSLGTPPAQLHPNALLGHTWRGVGTGISATAVVSNGELVIDDRPFDDTGADTSPLNGPPVQTGVDAGTLSGLCGPGSAYSTGDVSYPTGENYRGNAADLVQVRVGVDGATVHVLWQLETLVSPATTAVALLIDTDSRAATGKALAPTGFVGFEASLVVTSAAAALSAPGVAKSVPFRYDVVANTVEASFPLSALPRGPWRVNAMAGLPAGNELGTITDAAYVGDEPVESAQPASLMPSSRRGWRSAGWTEWRSMPSGWRAATATPPACSVVPSPALTCRP